MKLLFALALTLALGAFVVSAAPLSEATYQTLFTSWMRENDKVYSPFEFHERYSTWKANFDWIYEFPITNPDATFTVEMNSLGDLTDEEYSRLYTGYRIVEPIDFGTSDEEPPLLGLPASVDWRQKGIVTPVKNQGQCGSCWAFSATGSLEAAHAQKTGNLVRLSEQNLVDCSTSFGNHGCNGGLMDSAFRYIISNKGIQTEATYPYEARDSTCRYNKANCGSTLASFKKVAAGSESSLQDAVANAGPVSVAIDASPTTFRFYKSGVYYDASCSSSRLNHGVLAVGYGTEGSSAYWIVKNSWGTDWGNGGYILMSRNRSNNCGIATMSSWPESAGAGNC